MSVTFVDNDGTTRLVGSITGLPPLTATAHVSSAQILAAHDTPVEIIPAPGVGKMLLPITGIAKFTAGGTPYVSAGTSALEVLPAFMGVTLGQGATNLESTTDVLWTLWMDYAQEAFVPADVDNQPLVFHVYSANPTAGDGTLDFVVTYVVATLP